MARTQAQKGGEYGINGEWYVGGQFLPSSQATEKGKQNRTAFLKGKKVELVPYLWQVRPADGLRSIFTALKPFAKWDGKPEYIKGQGLIGTLISTGEEAYTTYVEAMGGEASEDGYNATLEMIEMFNNGERWYLPA